MNLMKNFNLNYLIQNIKKSKNILAILTILIPILNTIILIMMLTSNRAHILSFSEISITNIIGIYILPIVISICLFNYIYKRKSVDFINSMPISRKSIFITNTILGIIIFATMLLINTILTYTTCLIFKSPIPFMMLFDYFWFYLLVYIFAFIATNLAMTISGNAITQIVLTLLLFFLVPFMSFYRIIINEAYGYSKINIIECNEEACKPEKHYCYDNRECENNKELNKYSQTLHPITTTNYTTPFNLFAQTINYKGTIINTISIVKMLILSIIYTILGYILFLKRKMEVTETTFKSLHIHNIVKSLTMVPIFALAYNIVKNEEPIFIIFAIVILLIYYFIYDLITKKNISNIKLTLVYFISTLTILTTVFTLLNTQIKNDRVLNYKDIKEISIDLNNNYYTKVKDELYIDNKEVISLITKSMLNTESVGEEYIKVYFKTKNNKEYETHVDLDKESFNKLIDLLESENTYTSYYKNIDITKVYALKLGNKIYNKEQSQDYLKLINNILSNLTLKEYLNLNNKYNYINDIYNLKLYTYNNHDRKEFIINSYINYDLLNTVVNSNNSNLKDNITNIIPFDYHLYYENAYLDNPYNIDFYLIRSAKNEIYEFILNNINEEIDMKKEYFTFNIHLNGIDYIYTTNKVEEIKSLLDIKYNEIKDKEEYQEYYKDEVIEYYD